MLVLLVLVPLAAFVFAGFVVLVVCFLFHARQAGFDGFDLAHRIRRRHEHRCGVLERHQRLPYRLPLGIVARRVLEADHVHGGDPELDHQLLAFDGDVERSVSMLMRVMLPVPVLRGRERGARHEDGNDDERGPDPACSIQSPNEFHGMFSSPTGRTTPAD